jgi:hypothetical protein
MRNFWGVGIVPSFSWLWVFGSHHRREPLFCPLYYLVVVETLVESAIIILCTQLHTVKISGVRNVNEFALH